MRLPHAFNDNSPRIRPATNVSASYSLATATPSLADPPDLTGQISRIEYLTRGGYSDVWQGTWNLSTGNKSVAMKILKVSREPSDQRIQLRLIKRLQREMRVWACLNHPNVVALLGHTLEPEGPALISMFYENGSVINYLNTHPTSNRYQICADVCVGLSYLHSCEPPIIHGDIKGANILIDAEGNASLCDFGLSLIVDGGPTGYTSSEFGGSLRYLAPELMESMTRTAATDMYAVGCTCMQILLSWEPYEGIPDMRVLRAIDSGRPPFQLQTEHTSSLRLDSTILQRTWDPASAQRPSALELATALQTGLSQQSKVNRDTNNQPLVAATTDELVGDLQPDEVRPKVKKEGRNGWAGFNPRVPKVLEINLVLTLTLDSTVWCVRFSPDSKYLATGCQHTAQLYDTRTGEKICVLAGDEPIATTDIWYTLSICFSHDGKYLATGGGDKKIRIWDIGKRKIHRLFEGHTHEVNSVEFSRDGKLVVSGSSDKTVRIWNTGTGACKMLTTIESESIDASVKSVAISPDGRWVAAGSLDTVVRIWEATTGALVERLWGHESHVNSVVFTPDGRGLVSGSFDNHLKYWDITTMVSAVDAGAKASGADRMQNGLIAGNSDPRPDEQRGGDSGEMGSSCVQTFAGHKYYVSSSAVSPDGAWVVSGSGDRTVRFWNPKDGQYQLILRGHQDLVHSVDFSSTGGLLATGSGDGLARIWRYTTLQSL